MSNSSDTRFDNNSVTPPGTYTVEAAETWLRLVPDERHNAVLIEAKKGTHELELEQAMALSVSGESEDEQDHHHVMLLLPGGSTLEATGTYSGIRARGFFEKTMNSVKKKANNAYKKAKSTVNKAASSANKAAQQATQKTQKHANQAAAAVQQSVKSAKTAALQAKQDVERTVKRATSIAKLPSSVTRPLTGKSNQWIWWSQIAIANASKEAEDWLRHVYIDRRKCKVMGPAAIGTPGVLKSRHSFQGKIRKGLQAAGAPDTVSRGWDKGFKDAWEKWTTGVQIPGLPLFPSFSAFPGPQAPPTPNIPIPLSALISAGAQELTPPKLSQTILNELGNSASQHEAKNAVHAFATDLGGRFAICMAGCNLMNVMGSGPIPTFRPPMVPVGSVVNGFCSGGLISSAIGFNQPVPSLKDLRPR